jgi:L-ascorbate metabolism protein UlaG (beta-lactamase superfamily)
MKLQLIRSATLRITYGNRCFLIDPYFAPRYSLPSFAGKSPNPLVDLPFTPSEILSGVEMVIVSHLHSDHFDSVAQDLVAKDIPLLCQPNDEQAIRSKGFTNVSAIEDSFSWNGIAIRRTLCEHGSGEVLKEMGKASGFLFTSAGEPSLYWAGDTVLCPRVASVIEDEKPDVIVIHSCGAVWGNHIKIVMDEVQTVDVCKTAPGSVVIATHMESLDHATVSRAQLRNYARSRRIADEQLLIPADGEILFK